MLETLEEINKSVDFLPERFRKEFIEEVLVIDDDLAPGVVQKVLEYYLDEILEELTVEEIKEMFVVFN